MSKFIRFILIALVPAVFCSLLSSPLSYAFPLNCPEGSRVIGIECFDANYNNTTPWYRKDMGASEATFPFWLALGLVLSGIATYSKLGVSLESPANEAQSFSQPGAPVAAAPHPASNRSWLPTECPHCGGAIDTENVKWVDSFEAHCPYCDGVIKKPSKN